MRSAHAMKVLRALIVPIALCGALVAACGDDSEGSDSSPTVAAGGDVDDGDSPAGVPEECRTAFPQALGPADLSELTLLPDGFPEPPVAATLCITAETVGGRQETASYATAAGSEEILAGYEAALAAYGATRDHDGVGRPIVVADAGDVTVQVTPQDGGFVLALAR